MYTTYALYSKSANVIYVGQTDDFDRRFKEHNGEGDFKTWASRYAPWVLFYSETYQTRAEAVAREKFLKTGTGREFLRKVLAGWSPPSADSSLGS